LAAAYFVAAVENNLKLGEFSIAFNKSWVPLQFQIMGL